MRRRNERLLPPAAEAAPGRARALVAPPERTLADVTTDKPDELTWWDWTVFLLHTAAEIEHALLVQYLYAAYSLAGSNFSGTAVPADAATQAKRWQQTIIGIARDEMAHLLTVENILRFIGGPPNLEREDFPIRAFLYPFPLRLEPLTRTSLAKYVAAEMPADPAAPAELIDEIVERATEAAGGAGVNRVGVVYDALVAVFADPSGLADADLRPDTLEHQAQPADWFAFGGLIVRAVATRADAVAALRAIGEQGEGSASPRPGSEPSHFDKFLAIYTAFPETDPARTGGPVAWVPARDVPTDPNTLRGPSGDPALERGRITHPLTRLWAHLCNVRYRMLLLDITHALHLSGPVAGAAGPTARGHLRDWAFAEMRTLRGLANQLMTLPLKEHPLEGDPAFAAPPFELPYTLQLPQDERDRWRTHRALRETSGHLLAAIRAAGGTGGLLDELTAADEAARSVIDAQLPAPEDPAGRRSEPPA